MITVNYMNIHKPIKVTVVFPEKFHLSSMSYRKYFYGR